jgi:hypothetical protein
MLAGDDHVVLAIWRDHADAAPIGGVIFGAGRQGSKSLFECCRCRRSAKWDSNEREASAPIGRLARESTRSELMSARYDAFRSIYRSELKKPPNHDVRH